MKSGYPIIPIAADPLSQSAHFLFAQIDAQGNFIYANAPLTALLSLSLDENPSQIPADQYMHHSDRALFREKLALCFSQPGIPQHCTIAYQTTHPVTIQWEMITGNDTADWIQAIGYRLSTEAADIHGAEQKTALFNSYLDAITDGFFAVDRNWTFIRVNSLFEKVSGYRKEDMLGRNFWELFPDVSEQPYAAAMRKAYETSETVSFEQPWPPAYHFTVSVFPSQEGLACYFLDISAQKKHQLALEDSQVKLKAILDSTTDVNVLISADKKVLNFNQMAAQYARTYFNRSIAVGDDFIQFVMPETLEAFLNHFNQALNGEKTTIERPLPMPNGDMFWFELLYYPVYSEAGQLLGVAMNITNIDGRKKTEMKLLQQYDKLREIAYLQSHEARAPLSNILGLLNVLMLYKEKYNDPEFLQIIDYLSNSAHRLDEVIQRIVLTTRD